LALATGWLLGGVPHPAKAQRPLNLDFERSSVSYADRPWGWTFGWSAFAGGPAASFTLDSTVHREGHRSLRIERPDSIADASPEGIILQLPSEFLRGREVRLAGWARTTGLRGRAMLILEAWKDREFAAADTAWSSSDAAAAGSGDWAGHEVRIHVPDDPTVHSVVITLALEGHGTAWFDDLTLSADGVPLTTLPRVAEPPAEAELAWLARHAAPLRDVQAPVNGAPDDSDLRLVADIVGAARVVGLGESTHGTREFFQVKHRLLFPTEALDPAAAYHSMRVPREYHLEEHGRRIGGGPSRIIAEPRIEDREVNGLLQQVVDGVFKGAGEELPRQIDGQELGLSVDVLVAGHGRTGRRGADATSLPGCPAACVPPHREGIGFILQPR
jgi:hypothetical protein